ncbi:uncharacterized protein LOC124169908 [Ischnura elegans]|uniref:uncharacterized protein LOC124169908 n=1 Tax=Ischnura elegans TaxID=197161 RepID=UPI001ED88D4A|nr:uncharacterized protein LOC124169908 [Ischnura elegans]
MASSRLAVKIGMSWNWSDVRREFEIVIPAHGREVDVIRVPPNKARMLGRVRKGPLKILDKRVKRALKDWMYLPMRASWEICHLDPRKGGAGVFPTAEQVEILTVSHAPRLLSSREPWVRALVDSAITKTVRTRTRREPEERDIAEYLSGSMRAEFGRYRFDVASLWSDVRMASSRLAVKIGMSWNWSDVRREFDIVIPAHGREVVVIRVPPNKARMLGKLLRDAVRHRYLARLLAKPDQGKVFECISASPFSNHFLRTGANTRFCDWRFVHRARLGVVPLNAATRWGPRDDLRCRRCGWQSETLPHVLDHCKVHSSAWRGRHDAILHRLAGEVPRASVEIRVDRTPPMIDSALRPDLVVVDEGRRKIVIVDVTVPFENRKNALDVASLAAQRDNVGYRVNGIPITVLAYADDVALVSRKPDGMMKLLDLADRIAAWSGLKFNPRKCATLHVAGGRGAVGKSTGGLSNNKDRKE